MRILLLTHYYRPEIGAPQRRWDTLVERFVRAGHEVVVLAPSPHYPSGRLSSEHAGEQPGAIARGAHGEMIHRLPFREYGRGLGGRGADQVRTSLAAVATGLTRFRGAHRPDVIIATVPGLPTLPAGLVLGAALRVPVVLEMRDAWPDLLAARADWDERSMRQTGTHRPSRWTTRTVSAGITGLQRRAAAVVTTTETFAEVLRTRGVVTAVAIRHGTSVTRAPSREAGNGRPLRVLYAGTIGRSQGVSAAVEAAVRCLQDGVPIDLRIVGDGAQADLVRTLARSLGLPVTFLPTVPAHEVASHYAWADSVLVSLRDWEPLRWTVPSKLYDALATGRHVSGALSGEAAEIVRRTGAGHVVPPANPDALAALWRDLSANNDGLDVGTEARTWVAQNADDDALANRYLEVLERVVARG